MGVTCKKKEGRGLGKGGERESKDILGTAATNPNQHYFSFPLFITSVINHGSQTKDDGKRGGERIALVVVYRGSHGERIFWISNKNPPLPLAAKVAPSRPMIAAAVGLCVRGGRGFLDGDRAKILAPLSTKRA